MNVSTIKALIAKGQAITKRIEKIRAIVPNDEWGIPEATVMDFVYLVSAEVLAAIHESLGGNITYRDRDLGEAWLEVEGVTFKAMGVKEGELNDTL